MKKHFKSNLFKYLCIILGIPIISSVPNDNQVNVDSITELIRLIMKKCENKDND